MNHFLPVLTNFVSQTLKWSLIISLSTILNKKSFYNVLLKRKF